MTTPISKKMLINVVHPEEARVAIVHDGRLMELNIEITGKEQTKGNIYKGVVLRVEPGLQAAFVDIGRAKPGFLQIGELHPDFWQWREDIPEDQRKRRPRIQEVLRRGQELLVQVEKDERDNKGSALTTYLSLPGRYMVIMPGSDSSGISRKVEQEGVRKQLKEIMSGMNIPEGIGYIIRTEAVGRTPEELQRDLDSLVGMYNGIKQTAAEIKGAGEVYRDSGLVIRFIRDYFSDDIDEVLVDSKEAYAEAKAFFRENMPKREKLIKLHKEKRPIFSRFQLEEQIDQIYEKRVPLPSGGSLIIEPTEALVSIDVNSGKTSGEKGVEDTAFRTNMEAAEEVARQLRLRDLGGLIMIDFIDMRDRKHNHDVEKTLKQALKMDKARVNLGRISEFGILEMSRQRIAKTLNDAIHLACPHCEGRGKVKSVEAMAVSFLRKVHAAAAKGTVAEVQGGLPLEVAYYLLNRKKRELTQIENDYDIEVTVKGKTSFLLNQLELEVVKRDKHHHDEIPLLETTNGKSTVAVLKEETAPETAVESQPAPETAPAVGDAAKKRKRRRKKKKTSGEAGAVTEQMLEPGLTAEPIIGEQDLAPEAVLTESAPAGATEPATEETDVDAAAKPKKRKRRRSRKPKAHEEIATGVEVAEGETPPALQPVAEIPTTAETQPAEKAADLHPSPEKPKKTRPPRTRKKPAAATALASEAPAEQAPVVATAPELPLAKEAPAALPEPPAHEPAAPKKTRRRAPKKPVEEPVLAKEAAPVLETEKPNNQALTPDTEVATEIKKPRKSPRARRPKKQQETP